MTDMGGGRKNIEQAQFDRRAPAEVNIINCSEI